MHRIHVTMIAVLVLGLPGFAEEARPAAGSCPVSEKVSGLLKEWEKAAAESKALAPAEREKLGAKLAALAKECPAGSRMGPTLAAARDVLAASIACEESQGKSCPLDAAPAGGPNAAALAEGKALKAARSHLIRNLHQLVSHATACCASSTECCAAAAKGGETVVAKPATATDAGSKDPAACAKELAARVGALKASWAKAGEEMTRVPAAKREEAMKGYQSLAASCKSVALFPPTVLALTEGFEALDTIHGRMDAWALANPSFLASLPAEARSGFEKQGALVRDTRDALRIASALLKSSGPCEASCPAEKAKGEAPRS